MRVLYFTGAYRADSMASHTHGVLVAAIRARGIAIDILTTGPHDQPTPIAQSSDRHGTCVFALRPDRQLRDRVRRLWSARWYGFAPFLSYVAMLQHFFTPERRAAYDLVQVGMAFPYATMLGRALGSNAPPMIVNVTGGDVLADAAAHYGYARKRAAAAAMGRTLRAAALVEAISPLTAVHVETVYRCLPERIVVQAQQSAHEPLPHAAVATFRAAARARLRSAGTIPPGTIIVGLGRMLGIKGFDDVIRALPIIRQTHPDASAIFAGPARDETARAYATSLRRLASQLGVAHAVSVRPEIAPGEVPDLLASADLLVVPSLLDGLNMTGIEAGAFGTPCIVSAAAGLAAYVRQYNAGVVVPPRAPQQIARATSSLLREPVVWKQASAGAHEMATFFTLDRTADRFAAFYERVSQPTDGSSGASPRAAAMT